MIAAHGTTATETQRGDDMDFYETMKSGALCGNSGGGGGNVKNYMTSDIEVGTIGVDGKNSENANRLRTKDFAALGAGTYTVFYTSNLQVVAFKYATDGTFIERLNGGYFQNAPLTFNATEGQKFKFVFNTASGTTALSPSDLKNLVLFKN